MNRTTAIVGAAAVAAGIMAMHLWQEQRAGREQLAALNSELSQLEQSRAAASVVPRVAEIPGVVVAPDAPAPAPAPAAASPATPPRPAPTAPDPEQLMAGMSTALSDPAMQDLVARQVRAALAQQYPDLASEVGLSAEETQRFLDLLARQAAGMTGDMMGMMGGQRGAGGLDESMSRMMEQEEASDREIRAMLGSRYGKWEEYQGKMAAGMQVSQLRALLGSGENALSEDKAKALTAAIGLEMARSTREYRQQSGAGSRSGNVLEQQLEMNTKQNERALEVAGPHLTAAQLDRFRTMLQQQETMIRSMMGAMGGQSGARGGAPR